MPTIKRHPGTLTAEEIDDLLVLANKFADKAPNFCAWLFAHAKTEHARREAADAGSDFLEPELPELNAVQWSDTQLVDALWVSFTIGNMLRDRPNASKLMADAHNHLILWARNRFRDPREPDGLARNTGASDS